MEIELKLLLAPGDAAALRRHPLLREHVAGKPVVRQLTSIYFDTPDCYLRRHEIALRVRRVNRGWVQTLKGGGSVSAGLHRRDEWESKVARAVPDLPALIDLAGMDSYAAGIVARAGLAEALVPVFVTRFRRSAWLLRFEGGDEIELALDQGAVEHGEASEPISEIELELKRGDPARLFEFALQLQQQVPLRVCNVSKAQRGYALFSPQPPPVLKAGRVKLAPKQSVEQALLDIVANCMEQVQGNEQGVATGRDPESVHQMRVGMRRLRAALKLFERAAPCPPELDAELRWLSGELGAARDWEVLADGTLAWIGQDEPDRLELLQLRQAVRIRAGQARGQAAAAVSSARYAGLLLQLGAWIQCRRWRESASEAAVQELDAPLSGFAGAALEKAHKKLRKRGRPIRGKHARATPEERHRMRIAAKQLRYAAEFFEALYPAGAMRSYLKALSEMQEVLGLLNDAAVAEKLMEQLAADHAGIEHSAGFACGYVLARSSKKIRKLARIGKRFDAMKPPAA